ncbi:hypothetical protein QWJ34_26935 [Saccharibacillus sp. CPCC 101409]|uniref:hypothetical protein n=1 Tax=Saccharibacillus sp. CPCC 101409 TaxID=3058041 RepID=UPI0026734CE5|nr:hypothetical protein [Saccharibacillus sp. CPCC 101409]MDO3413414.1 hypothetical protein [Saccharibacillus sp. CPCC 101409]
MGVVIIVSIIIGLVGWRVMVKEIPGSMIGSLLAGLGGGFFGAIGGTGMDEFWYILLCGAVGAALMVVIVNLIIVKVNRT